MVRLFVQTSYGKSYYKFHTRLRVSTVLCNMTFDAGGTDERGTGYGRWLGHI